MLSLGGFGAISESTPPPLVRGFAFPTLSAVCLLPPSSAECTASILSLPRSSTQAPSPPIKARVSSMPVLYCGPLPLPAAHAIEWSQTLTSAGVGLEWEARRGGMHRAEGLSPEGGGRVEGGLLGREEEERAEDGEETGAWLIPL